MNAEADFTNCLNEGVFPKSLLLFTIIKTDFSGLKNTSRSSCANSSFLWCDLLFWNSCWTLWTVNKHPAVPFLVPAQHISIPSSSLSTLVLCFVALVITAASSHSCRSVDEILLTTDFSLGFGFFYTKAMKMRPSSRRSSATIFFFLTVETDFIVLGLSWIFLWLVGCFGLLQSDWKEIWEKAYQAPPCKEACAFISAGASFYLKIY